ncbi:MAG: sulfatase-like hydrolase/transferase [Thermoanaerobaculia bacterium]
MKKILFIILFYPLLSIAEKLNIILISIDTLNIKRTSLFNYEENTTPFLKKLSEMGINFENSFTPTPLTLPAHSTLLTGIYPHHLGVYDNLNSALSSEYKTIPEVLKENGYKTAGIVSSYILSSSFGISKGFDIFEEISLEKLKGGATSIPERDASKTTDLALKYLKNLKSPFFLFIHYFDPHIPYNPPEPFRSQFKDLYDGEVAFVDTQIERLFNNYKDIKNCWVFIVSDHGEGLGENEELTHGYFLYKNTVQVLTLILPPERERINLNKNRLTSLADIFPTILKISKIEKKDKVDGVDIFSERKGFLPLETFYGFFHHNFMPLRGITDGKVWYIFNFDKENRDYNKIIKELFTDARSPARFFEKNLMDKEITSLGYLKGPVKDVPPMEKWKSFPSPFEKKDFINKITLALEGGENYENLKELEKEAPDDPEVLKLLGDYFKKNKDFQNSIKYYEKALKYSPFYYEINFELSKNYLKIGKFKEALYNIESYLKIIPEDSIALFYKGSILEAMGKEEDAIIYYKKSLEKGFNTTEVYIKLSLALIKIKKEREAEETILKYLKDKKSAPLYYILGNIYKNKDKEKAKKFYMEAMSEMPGFLPPYIEISDILKIEEGKEILKKALQIDPSFDLAWEKLGDLYLKEKNSKKALECYNNALKFSKDKERIKRKIKELEFE